MTTQTLEAPFIPAAKPDGLVMTSCLDNDLTVTLKVPSFVRTGDSYQLLLNNRTTGPVQAFPVPPTGIGSDLESHISKSEFACNGEYKVSYRYISYPGGNITDSEATSIHVDRTQPGATLLAPLIFPTASFSDQLTGLLPGYAGMQQGDVVQTLLNGSPGPTHTVTADELTLSPIEIVFTREHLKGHAPGMVSIEYTVTDRAGNTSITSLPTLVSVQL
jgi:hypothetical protein